MENAGVAQLFGFTAGASFDDVYARVSVVRLLIWVVSYVIAAKETAYEDWEEEVRAVADATHYGTEAWWVEAAKAWQEGDALTVVDGRVGYAVVDPTHRVVTAASVNTEGRTLRLKVAKGAVGSLQALTASQLEAFQGYVEAVKPVGLHVTATSGVANVVKLQGTVRYSAELNKSDVKAAVRGALTAAMSELRRLSVGRAYIVGGTGAVSASVESARCRRNDIRGGGEMRNWNNTIGLLLPVKLQRSVRLRSLLQVLLSRTVGDALRAERKKEEVKAEHRYIGQGPVLLELLRERFGQTVALTGQEDGLVVLVGARGSDYERWASASKVAQGALIVPSVANSDVGTDFVVTVDAGTDVGAVSALVRRYALAGVGFKVRVRLVPDGD